MFSGSLWASSSFIIVKDPPGYISSILPPMKGSSVLPLGIFSVVDDYRSENGNDGSHSSFGAYHIYILVGN